MSDLTHVLESLYFGLHGESLRDNKTSCSEYIQGQSPGDLGLHGFQECLFGFF